MLIYASFVFVVIFVKEAKTTMYLGIVLVVNP